MLLLVFYLQGCETVQLTQTNQHNVLTCVDESFYVFQPILFWFLFQEWFFSKSIFVIGHLCLFCCCVFLGSFHRTSTEHCEDFTTISLLIHCYPICKSQNSIINFINKFFCVSPYNIVLLVCF